MRETNSPRRGFLRFKLHTAVSIFPGGSSVTWKMLTWRLESDQIQSVQQCAWKMRGGKKGEKINISGIIKSVLVKVHGVDSSEKCLWCIAAEWGGEGSAKKGKAERSRTFYCLLRRKKKQVGVGRAGDWEGYESGSLYLWPSPNHLSADGHRGNRKQDCSTFKKGQIKPVC